METGIRKFAAKAGGITAICTVVICGLLFFFMVKTDMALADICVDMSITVGCTCLCCTLIQILTLKKAVKKGDIPTVGNLEDQAAYVLVPKNPYALMIYVSLLATLLFGFAPSGILALILGDGAMPRMGYVIFKALMAGLGGGLGTYHANIFVVGLYQEQLAAVPEA